MIIENCKVTFDGSFYVAKAPQPSPYGNGKKKPRKFLKAISIPDEPTDTQATTTCENQTEDISEKVKYAENARAEKDGKEEKKAQKTKKIVVDLKEIFNELYLAHAGKKKKKEIREEMLNGMRPYFDNYKELSAFVDMQLERVYHNKGTRSCRLWKKMNNVPFNYFITVTYDDKKHTEESFKKKLKMQLSSFASRRKWKYMGVWERSPKKQRLHFHGIFYIPEGSIPGELLPFKDYSFSTHRMQVTWQSLYFNEHFGRSDFEKIEGKYRMGEALAYLMKYLEKTGERIVYSKGLPQFFISDIMDEDIACKLSEDESDNKVVLFDNFGCWDEGCYIGQVSPEVIEQLRKVA